LWAGKYRTTGHGSLIIGDDSGNIIFVSEPAPGCDHDMKKLEGEVKEILDLAGSVIADKGFQVDRDTAYSVGRRKSVAAAVLVIRASEARQHGARFWPGNQMVWLADYIPPTFIGGDSGG
jgi:putative RNA 2'-phosphotransferase